MLGANSEPEEDKLGREGTKEAISKASPLEAPRMSLSSSPPPEAPTSCLSLHRPLDVVCTEHGLLDLTVLHQVEGHHEGPHGILPLGQKDDLQREKTRTITSQTAAPAIASCVGESTPVRGGQPEPGPSRQSAPPAPALLESAFHRERPECSRQKTVPLTGST